MISPGHEPIRHVSEPGLIFPPWLTDQQLVLTVHSSDTYSGTLIVGCPLAFSFAFSAASPVVESALHVAMTSAAAARAFAHAAT